jgi:hypothetical protein
VRKFDFQFTAEGNGMTAISVNWVTTSSDKIYLGRRVAGLRDYIRTLYLQNTKQGNTTFSLGNWKHSTA